MKLTEIVQLIEKVKSLRINAVEQNNSDLIVRLQNVLFLLYMDLVDEQSKIIESISHDQAA